MEGHFACIPIYFSKPSNPEGIYCINTKSYAPSDHTRIGSHKILEIVTKHKDAISWLSLLWYASQIPCWKNQHGKHVPQSEKLNHWDPISSTVVGSRRRTLQCGTHYRILLGMLKPDFGRSVEIDMTQRSIRQQNTSHSSFRRLTASIILNLPWITCKPLYILCTITYRAVMAPDNVACCNVL